MVIKYACGVGIEFESPSRAYVLPVVLPMAMIHMNLVQSMSPMYSRQTRKRLLLKRKNENVFDMIMATRRIAFGGPGQMDVPKDRSSLANMRVIRRNLVYAVGLPPSIATEDILRKPEYFGQYGKIAKIVLNRTNVTSSDPRRASASAYVTFVHKVRTIYSVMCEFIYM